MSGGDLVGVPEPGDVIAEKYRLDRVIGKGAAGIVFEATHELIGRRVALKWLYPHLAFNETVAKRFLREARAANVVDHPCVVEIYDAGHEGDSLYLVMELLRGEPLSTYIERGVEDPEDLVQILMPALRGIAAAHDHGVIHRDLKPDNIFLSSPRRGRAGGAKVLDFGISKLREGDRNVPLTSAGTYLGSPYYMAPEQIADSSTVDARADVYSIGVILYQALTGNVPYDAESLAGLFNKITNTKPTPIAEARPGVNEELVKVVMKAMSPRPDDRYASVKKLAEALEPFAGGAVFATLDEALGDALGDALARRAQVESALREPIEDEEDGPLDENGLGDDEGEVGELEQAPTMVSRELGRQLMDTDEGANATGASDEEAEFQGRSTAIDLQPRDTNPERAANGDARDTDPPERDTDPSKIPAPAKPPPQVIPPRASKAGVMPPPPASRALAALSGAPAGAGRSSDTDLEASPTKPLIKVDEVEGAPGDIHMANTLKPGALTLENARTMEMSKPNWEDTSMVGRSFKQPPATPERKGVSWGAIIGACLVLAVVATATLYFVALK